MSRSYQVIDSVAGGKEVLSFLRDPEPQEVHYTLISVDDHLVEPPDMFEGRLPAKLQERAPRVVETEPGTYFLHPFTGIKEVGSEVKRGHAWLYEDELFTQVGLNAVAGYDIADYRRLRFEPGRFDEMRPGCYEIEARIKDVTFPEVPSRIGMPSIFTDHLDPIFRACEETDTAVCLHVGSSGILPLHPDAPAAEVKATSFPVVSLLAAIDWVWSGVPVRFPGLKIVMAEGGIGWVPLLLDRLEFMVNRSGEGGTVEWVADVAPTELVHRNFYFCSLDDPSTLPARNVIGVDHIMMEVDYPHADTTWPDSQALLHRPLQGLPVEDVRKITHENAARVFRHPLPPVCRP